MKLINTLLIALILIFLAFPTLLAPALIIAGVIATIEVCCHIYLAVFD